MRALTVHMYVCWPTKVQKWQSIQLQYQQEIGHWRLLEMAPFDRSYTTYY